MSQHDMTVDNGAGVAVRTDINLALKALASQSSGASAPTPTFPAQIWADTGTGRLRQRDAANANWVDKGPIDGAMAPLDSPVFTGQPTGALPCIVGETRSAKMSISTASATGTLTADEVVVKSALGGLAYKVASFSKTINLATAGAGGMDTGAAPVNGFVAIYAIYNPSTGASALLATNATSVKAAEVYVGANMPSGYTASALVGVWPTNASSQFIVGYLDGDRRELYIVRTAAFNSSTAQGALTSVSLSSKIPLNAKEAFGDISGSTTGGASESVTLCISADANGTGQIYPTGQRYVQVGYRIPIITAQTAYYLAVTSSGTLSYQINISGYTF